MKSTSPPRRSLLARVVRASVLLLGLVIVARWLLVDTWKVPTDSMQPFVHGDPESGDRVVVFKPAFWWSEPTRFDPVLLREDGILQDQAEQYLLKRVVALGGERLEIQNGDLFISPGPDQDAALYCKSYQEFGELLVDVWEEPLAQPHNQRLEWDTAFVERRDAHLYLRPVAVADPLPCRYGQSIHSGFVDADGQAVAGSQEVHDVLLEVLFIPQDAETGFVAEMDEGLDQFRFVLHPGRGRAKVEVLHRRPDGLEYPTTAQFAGFVEGQSHRIEVWNIDDTIGVAVDGQVVLTSQHSRVERILGVRRADPRFGVIGGEAAVSGVRLRRDLYYLPGPLGSAPVSLAPGEVFVLGDNSENSRDSRHFGPVAQEQLVGRPFAVCAPWSRMRILP